RKVSEDDAEVQRQRPKQQDGAANDERLVERGHYFLAEVADVAGEDHDRADGARRPEYFLPVHFHLLAFPLSPAPAHGIDGAHGEKDSEHDPAGVKDQAGSIDNAAREIVVMPDHR